MSWRFSHFARSPEMYEEPLSDNSLGRWRTLALSSAAASSAISSVAGTTCAAGSFSGTFLNPPNLSHEC